MIARFSNLKFRGIGIMLLFVACAFVSFSQLDATFSSPDADKCPGNLFTINANTTTYSSYNWTVTGPSFSQTPTGNSIALYLTNSGQYTVTLTVGNGVTTNTSTVTNFLTVYNVPVIIYSLTPTSGCSPLTVAFNGSCTPGSGTLSSFSVNSGSGTNYTTEDFSHVYTVADTFTPNVTVTNSFGCITTGNLTDVIVRQTPSLTSPTNPNSVCSGSVFNYTPTATPSGCTFSWTRAVVSGISQAASSGTGNISETLTNTTGSNINVVYVFTITHPNGCVRTQNVTVSVRALPTVTITPATVAICSGQTTTLTATGSGTGGTYTWSPGGATTSTRTVTTAGTYSVVYSDGTCASSSVSRTVSLATQPTVTLSVAETSMTVNDGIICSGSSVVITASPSIAGGTYLWGGGTAQNATTSSVTVSPTTTTAYTLTYTNVCASSPASATITVYKNPIPAYTSSNSNVCSAPATTTYTSVATAGQGTITSTSWSFPGGLPNSSLLATPPPVTYNVGGTSYSISQTITNSVGCSAITVFPNAMVIGNGTPPTSSFTNLKPLIQCVDIDSAKFVYTGTGADTIRVDWGDGFIEFKDNIGSFSRKYALCGTYTVTLTPYKTIGTSLGCAGTPTTYTMQIKGPQAKITASAINCSNQGDRTFTAGSCGTPTMTLQWDITNTFTSPPYSFSSTSSTFSLSSLAINANPYKVKLTATDATTGCATSIDNLDYYVFPNNLANFKASTGQLTSSPEVTEVCIDGCLNLINTTPAPQYNNGNSPSSIFTRWEFNTNDGLTWSTNAAFRGTPKPCFPLPTTPGSYGIAMINRDANGCNDTIIKNDYIKVYGITGTFTVADTNICANTSITFNGSGITTPLFSSIVSRVWSWGDGTPNTLNVVSPTHTFTTTGPRTVTLTVTDVFGCVRTITLNVLVRKPLASFSVDRNYVCENQTVTVTNASTGNSALTYAWLTTGATPVTSTLQNPGAFTFNTIGNGSIKLTVTETSGCSDDTTIAITVNNPFPNSTATPNFVSCFNPPTVVNFTNTSSNNVDNTSAIWNFGNGQTSTNWNPSTTYNLPGTYVVSLTVSSLTGCSATRNVDTITIGGPFGTIAVTSALTGCSCYTASINVTTSAVTEARLLYGDGQFLVLTPNTTQTVNYSYCNNGSTTITRTPSLYISNGTCNGFITAAQTITIKPTPTVNTIPNQVKCAGTSSDAVTFGGNIPGTTYTWSNSNTTTGLAASGTGDIPSFVTSNTTLSGIVSTITVTPSFDGCIGTPRTFTITVGPRPVVTISSTSICYNGSVTVTPATTTNGSWSGTTSVATISSAGTISNLSVAGGNVTFTYTETISGCTNSVNLTVNPRPSVTAGSQVCSGSNITLSPTTGGTWASNPGTGTANVVPTTGVVTGGNPGTVTFTFTNSTTLCTNTTTAVTVNALPVVSVSPSTVCQGTGATATPTPSAPGTWVSNDVDVQITNAGVVTTPNPITIQKTATLTYTRTSTGCSASTTITVNPIPVLTAPTSVCIGTQGNLTPSSGGTWTSSNTSVATVTNAGVITGVAAGNVTFTYVQNGTLCSATTPSVAINATPIISNMTTTVCSGTAFSVTPVNGTNGTVPTGTTYTWSAPSATGITGTAAGTAASLISGTLTNTTSSTQTVAYTVTPILGSCSGTPFTVTVTVNPRPTIAAKTATICSGGTFTVTPSNTAPDIVPTGTTYTWTVTANNNVNGESAQATGQTNISQTLTGNASVQTVNYTVTPTSPSGTCVGSTFPLTVTVNPIPTFTATNANPSSCGATNGSITLSGLTANTSYQVTYVLLGVTTGPTQRTSSGTGTIALSSLSAGSYTVSIALTSTGCQSATQVVTLTNPGAPDINDIADQVLCGGSYTLPTITGTNLPGNQAYYSAPSGGGNVLTGSISTSQTVYIYGISAGGCSDQESFTVTINTPASIAAKTATICSNGTFTVTPTNTAPDVVPAGTTYSWAAPSVIGVTGLAAGTAQTSISGTLVNTLNTPRTVVYSVTPTSGTCSGAAFNVTVTLNPVPAITDMTANACSTSAFSVTPTNSTNGIVPTGTTYTWSAPTPAIIGGSAQATGQTLISQTLTNSTTTSTTATYTVTPTSGTCVGSTFQLVVTVNPRPVVTNTTATICSGGTFTVTPATGGGNTIPSGTTYSWSAPSVVGISGTAAGTNQPSISGTPANTTNAPINVVYVVTPTSGSCSGTPFNVTVTVNPTPTISTINATACSGSLFTVTPANTTNGIVPSGTTYTWAAPTFSGTGAAAGTAQSNISGTLTQSTSSAINVTYTVTPTSGTCVGTAFSVTVAVNPNPAITNMTTTVCSGTAFTVTPINSTNGTVPTGTTYSWAAPSVTGVTGTVAGTNSTNISGTLINTTTTTRTIVYNVTPTLGSCSGASFTVTITLNPAPIIAAKTATICSAGSFTVAPTDGTGGDVVPTGTSYSWVAPSASGITGTLAGTGATDITGTLTNTSNAPIDVVYTVTPTVGSCSGTPFTVTVTVNPRPAINAMTTTTCSATAFNVSPLNGTNGVVPTGTTYTWTVVLTAPVFGESSQATAQATISQNLSVTSATQTANYTVTPTFGTCVGSTFPLTVTINPRPTVTNKTAIVCSGGTFTVTPTSGSGNTIPTGTTYSWPAPSPVIGITGITSGTNASNISGTLTNTTNAAINVVYVVTPTTGSCTNSTFNVTVTVNPAATINPITTSVCSGNSFTVTPLNTTNGVIPNGTTYTWAAPVVADISGTLSGAALSNISGTLLNSTSSPIPVVYTVTPQSATCTGTDFTVTVTVNPNPVVNNLSATTCSGTAFSVTPIDVTDGLIPSGTTYTWSAPTANGITGTASGTSAPLISGTLTNTISSAQTVVYSVTPTLGSCSGTPFNVTVTVNPRPTIAAKTATICSGETFTVSPANTLPDIVPTGTTYTWTVVSSPVTGESAQATAQTSISQTLTSASLQTVNYTITPTSGTCVGSTFPLAVTVNRLPTFTVAKTDPTTCGATNGTITLSGLTASTSYVVSYTLSPPAVTATLTSNASGQITISNLGAGTYDPIIVTLVSTGCQSASQSISLNNPGAPNINDVADQVLCGGCFALPTITGTNLPGNQAYYSSPNGIGPLTGPICTSQTVYIYGISAGGCSDQESFTVTINTPASIAAKTATICSDGTFTVTPTNTAPDVVPTGTTYSWAAPVVAGGGVIGLAAGTAAPNISSTLTNTTNLVKTVVYSVTPTSGSCSGAAFNVTVTLNPVPSISNMTANACSTSAFSVTPLHNTNGTVPTNTTYTWSAPTPAITGGSAQATGQTSISQTLTNSTTTSTTATYTVTPTSGTCVGTTFQLVVTVNPRPIVTNTTATICSGGTFTVTPATGGGNTIPTGTTYSWSAPSVVGISGTAAGTNQPSINGTPANTTNAPINVVYVVTPTSGSCSGTPFNVTVTVNPTPTISTINGTACSGSLFTVTPANTTNGIVPSGTTYTWAAPTFSGTGAAAGTAQTNITGNLTHNLSSPENATYTVIPTSGTCIGTGFSVIVSVNPNPVVNNLTVTACSGTIFTVSPVNITDGTVPTGTTYTWAAPSVLNINGTAAGTNASNISGTLINSTNASINVVYTVTPAIGSCIGTPFTVTVTVNPAPIIAAKTATICSNGTFTVTPSNTLPDVVPTGTTYSWVAPSVSGITGTAAGTASADINGTLTNTTNSGINVVYVVTPSFGSCSGTPFNVTVTVNPRPAITDMTANACIGSAFTSTPLNGTNGIVPIGTTYTWATPTPAITGGSAQGTAQNSISQTLSHTSASAVTASYVVTPTSGTCIGNPFTLVVTVSPRPVISDESTTICSAGTFTVTPASGGSNVIPGGTTYSWAAPTVSGITGTAAGTNAPTIGGTLTNTTNSPINVTYIVTPTVGGCVGATFNVTVTVEPRPAVTSMLAAICTDNSFSIIPVNTTNGIVPSGTTYSWAAPTAPTGISGTIAGSNLPSVSGTLTNTTNAGINVVYTVTPTSGTCVGSDFPLTVTVNPIPAVTSMTATASTGVAFSVSPQNITNGVVPGGTTYTWATPPTPPGIIGTASGSSQPTISGNLTNTTNSGIDVVYTVTPVIGNCTGSPFSVTVTVLPRPTITAKTVTICSGETFSVCPVNGVNGDIVPLGTTYTWTVTNNVNVLGESNQTSPQSCISQTLTNGSTSSPQIVIYDVTPTSGPLVGNPFTLTVTVNPVPTFTTTKTDPIACNGTDGTVTLVNLTPNTTFNYTIIGGSLPFTVSSPVTSNASGQIVIPNLGAGNYTITVINSTNCESTPRTVTLNNPGAPNVNDIADVLVCGTSYTLPSISGTNLPTAGNGTIGFFSFPNGVGSLTGTITSPVASTQTVYIYAATPGGCSDEESFQLIINPVPVVNVATATVCVNQTITLTATSSGAPTVGTWSSLNPTFASVNPTTGVVTGHIAGTASIIMTETGTNCASSATLVTIKALPTVSAGPNQTICSNSSVTLAGVLGGSATTGVWSGGSGPFVPSNTATNAVYTPTSLEILADSVILIYSTVDVTCSSVSDSVIIYIQDLPTVNAGANQTICSTSTALLGGTIGGSASSVTWTSSGAPGTLTSANTLTPTYTPVLADVGPAGITLTMTSNDPIGPCPAVTSTVLITVNPAATVNAGADFPACSKYAVPLAGLFGGSATSATWSGAGTYSPSNSAISQYSPTVAELSNPFIDLTLETNDPIGPCPAVTDVVRVTFAAPAIANAGPDQTICSGLPVNLVGTVSGTGTSGGWLNANAWGSPIPVGLNITYNPSSTEIDSNLAVLFVQTNDPPGPCPVERDTVLIHINPTPFLLGNNQFGSCTGNALNIPLTVAGGFTPITTFEWSAVNNPMVSGESIGTFNSNIIPDVLFNNNPLLVNENVIYNVTPTIGTCVGTPVSLTVTVLPRPTMQPVADQSVCANTLTSAINFVSNISNTSFNWTNSLPSIGFSSTGNGNIAADTAINNTGVTQVANFCATPSTNIVSPATTCPGTTQCFNITVRPISVLNDPVDQTICAGQSTNAVIFASSDPNTVYNWTSVTSSGGSIGLNPIGQGNIASFVGVNNGTVPIVATITVTPDLNGCLGTPQTFTITVKPLPVMLPIADRTVCVGNVSNTITFNSIPNGTTYVWTATNHTITGIPSASGQTNFFPSFTAVNVSDTVIPSFVHVVPTFNGCAGTPVDFTIFVNPILKADSIPNFVFCEGETFPTICITGNAPGVIYTWTSTNVSIGMPALGSTCISGFTTQAGNLFETATIFITPNLSGCQGIITNFTITVKPKPNVYISQYSQGHCHGVPTIPVHFTGDVAGTTFTWITQNTGIQNSSIYDNVYTSFGDLQSFTTYNQSTPYMSLIGEYDVVGTANGCVSDTGEFTITVDPTPTVNHVADQTVCAGQPTVPVVFTGNLPNGTVYNWGATAQAIYPTTWSIPGTGSIPSFVPPTNDLPYTVTSKVTVTPVFGFCTGAEDSLFFIVKPKPRVNQIPNQALCVGDSTQAVNFSGNMDLPLSEGPANYIWNNSNYTIGLPDDGVNDILPFEAQNSGDTVITAIITCTPQFNGCTGDQMSFTITTVAPIPIANPVPDQVLCAGEATDLITFVNPNIDSYPLTSFIWSNDNPIGIASSDTADASNSFEIPPFPTVGGFTPIVSTFDVIPYYAGCAGDTMSFTITVKPVPNVFISPQTQQACAGLPTVPVVFTGNVAGTSYDWTSNAALTGSGAGGNGNVPLFTAVNNTTNIITNMIICTPSLNQCFGAPDTAYIYVNPTTTVVLQQHNYSYCHGDSIPQICFVGNNPATEYHWTNPNIANGLPSSGIGCIPADTAENTDLFNYNDIIICQPQLNGCLGTPDTISIVVKPIPTLIPTPDINLCASNTISQICFTGNMTSTTTFNWSGNNSSIGINPISGINCIPSFVTVNSSQSIQASDFEVTPERQGCIGIADTFKIVVNPIAEAIVSDITVCNGETVPATTIFGTSPIADYIWNHNFPSNLTLPLTDTTSGSPDVLPSFVATNTSLSSPIVVPITITPLVNGCPGVDETINLTINPTPSVNLVSSQTWCHNELTSPITFTGPVTGTVFNWANTNGAIGIAGPGVNTLPAFPATNTDNPLAPIIGTISVIPQANSCIGDTVFFTITVNPLPVVNAGLDTTLCLGQFVVPQVTWQSLDGALAPVWSANPPTGNPTIPINGTPYYPNESTWLTVIGTDGNLCQNRDSLFITYLNVPPPIVNAGLDTALCFGESIALCATGNASVYVWDSGVFDCIPFTPQLTDTIICTGSSVSTGCYTKDTIVVTVNPLPIVITNASVNPVCLGDISILYGTGADTYVWDNNVIDSVGFKPSETDTFTVEGTDIHGCKDTAMIVIIVNPKPNVLFSSDMTYGGCLEFKPTFTDLTSPPSAQVTWLFGDNTAPSNTLDSVTHFYTNYGCYDVTLISTTAEGCTDSLTQQDFVCVNQIIADFEPDTFEQPISNPEFEFTNTSQNATSYEWFFGDGTGTDFVHPDHIYDSVGYYTVVLVASAQDGCTDTARITIKVRDEVIIWVPNTFTPDDNGLNDLFSPVLTAGYDRDGVYEFRIYNRWGEQIFFTDQYSVQWDGTYNGEKVQMGSYNWSLRFKDSQSNKIYDYFGHVNVLR